MTALSMGTAATMRVTPVGADMLAEVVAGRRLTAVWGGIGCGKSFSISQLCLFLGLTRRAWDPEAGVATGPIDILVTGRYRTDLMQNLGRAFYETFTPFGGRWVNDPRWYRWELPNGCRVTFQHYQCHGENASSIEGRNYHVLISDETTQLPPVFWMHAFERNRLGSVDLAGRVYPPQMVWLSRPASNDGFLREARRRAEEGADVAILYARTRDNKWNHPNYLPDIKAGRSLAEYEAITQEVVGATFPSRGAILDDFVSKAWPEGNLIDLAELDVADAPTILVLDPGIMHTSVLWVQVHEVGGQMAMVIVDEWHPHGTPTSIQQTIAEVRARPWRVAKVIADPASTARKPVAKLTSVVDVLRRGIDEDPDGLGGGLGVPVLARLATNRRGIKDGLMRVKARICSAAGNRVLLLARHLWDDPPHLHGVRHTVGAYAWDPVSGEAKKGNAADQSDHTADCMRYLVCQEAWHGPPEPVPEDDGGDYAPQPTAPRRAPWRSRR